MPAFSIAARFHGPPGSANGGYFAGRFASFADQTVRVRLQVPPPLETELQVVSRDGGRLDVLHGEQLVATAEPAMLELEVPAPPDYVDVVAASRRFTGFHQHAYPGCFVCGTSRARGDGMRIFAGANAGKTLVAAPWVPDESLANSDGKIRPEFMSAALDCPGYYAGRDDGAPMLLGEFTAHVDRLVHVGESCAVIGWRIAVNGRKYEVGTALFDEDGELCGRARATWIALQAPT
jgi:hypothetical protein